MIESNYDLIVLKTDNKTARELYKEMKHENFSHLNSFSAELLVDRKDVASVVSWMKEKGVECICGQRGSVIDESMDTFNVHPDCFSMGHNEMLLYQYIANKYDFKSLDIDMQNFHNGVLRLIYREEKEFCKENGIYDNYVWYEYRSPFLHYGMERLLPSLKVKILNEMGYRSINCDDATKEDVHVSFGVYARKVNTQARCVDIKHSLADQIRSAAAQRGEFKNDSRDIER